MTSGSSPCLLSSQCVIEHNYKKTVSPSLLSSPPLEFLHGALNGDGCTGLSEKPRATSTPVSSSPIIVNPFVAAGLVLADIFAPTSEDAAASKKCSKHMGVRELTVNEYTACLKEEERKRLKKKKEKRK